MVTVPLRDRTAQTVAEALIYRVIYLFGLPRQIICDEATEFPQLLPKLYSPCSIADS